RGCPTQPMRAETGGCPGAAGGPGVRPCPGVPGWCHRGSGWWRGWLCFGVLMEGDKKTEVWIMARITNPILTGFNPDPSICRAGEDYYIAVSTFEWFPGVGIYHSKDLKHWRLVARPLNRLSQLDMRG